MEISSLLCSSPESEEAEAAPASAPPNQETTLQAPSFSQASGENTFALVPDNQRKRTHRLSAAQKQQRREQQVYESRVYNLTLDINDLRQQIRQLMERRDLHITQLLLTGQHLQAEALKLSWAFLDGLQTRRVGLNPDTVSQHGSGGVHQFVIQQGGYTSTLERRAFDVKSIRILALVDGESTGESAREIRRVCGNAGGCVAEVMVDCTGIVTRNTIAIWFPHVLNNESLISRVAGQRISFGARFLLYFNTQRILVQQIAQADVVGAFRALNLDAGDFMATEDVRNS